MILARVANGWIISGRNFPWEVKMGNLANIPSCWNETEMKGN